MPTSSENENESGITFGGSIVNGDQVGHSGGTHVGDVVLGSDDRDDD